MVALALYYQPRFSTEIAVPFIKTFHFDLGPFYVPFAMLVIVCTSNAVNLTDGLDGLAIGPVMVAAGTYAVIAYVTGHLKLAEYLQIPYVAGVGELSVFCAAVVAAGLGFLWYNAYPAQMFMGDVGSLSLGAALGVVAVMTKNEILLIIVGGVFVMEALSVIFQVVSYKFRRKRVFLDGADSPSLRAQGLEGAADHRAVLDSFFYLRRRRLEHVEAPMSAVTVKRGVARQKNTGDRTGTHRPRMRALPSAAWGHRVG